MWVLQVINALGQNELTTAMDKCKKYHLRKETVLVRKVAAFFNQEYKTRFLFKVGEQLIPVSSEEIAYFMFEDGIVIAITQTNNHYVVNNSLEQLSQILNPVRFFRINRKFIVALDAIKNIHQFFNGRLLLELKPKQDKQVLVSREKITSFKEWLSA